MATVGQGVLHESAFELFEGMRSFDAARAAAVLGDDVIWDTPWSGRLDGKEAVAAWLETFLGDTKARPSMTIRNVSGRSPVLVLSLSASGRFGRHPQNVDLQILTVQDQVRQVIAV